MQLELLWHCCLPIHIVGCIWTYEVFKQSHLKEPSVLTHLTWPTVVLQLCKTGLWLASHSFTSIKSQKWIYIYINFNFISGLEFVLENVLSNITLEWNNFCQSQLGWKYFHTKLSNFLHFLQMIMCFMLIIILFCDLY